MKNEFEIMPKGMYVSPLHSVIEGTLINPDIVLDYIGNEFYVSVKSELGFFDIPNQRYTPEELIYVICEELKSIYESNSEAFERINFESTFIDSVKVSYDDETVSINLVIPE